MDILHIIFPVNLYKNNSYLTKNKYIAIIEEKYNFTYLNYHKLKLILHRSSMKSYYDSLNFTQKKYFDFFIKDENIIKFYKNKIKTIEFIDPCDHLIVNKWKKLCNKFNLQLCILPTLNFLITIDEIKYYKENYTNGKKYYHDRSFYPYMRKKLNVLVKDNKPIGNKWSFDKENRNKLPSNTIIPKIPKVNNSKYVLDAIKYINKYFNNNYGDTDNFIYPINHKSAIRWLNNFCKTKLKTFGDYQDFVSKDCPFIFHSILSPLLNIGLLTDRQVLDKVLKQKGISINNLEGFIRQLIGWKQYIFFIYTIEGEKIRNMNFLNGSGKLPKAFWTANTMIYPIDCIIKQVIKYAYAHHIQRLMFLGNFLLLCGYHPIEINNWFQAFVSIDGYDIFMIPNVCEMVCYAGGGIMMTRPYFSSSKYILKMSDFKKTDGHLILLNGKEYYWTEIWDSLYYRFIKIHSKILRKNYSTATYVLNLEKKSKKEIDKYIMVAEMYLNFVAQK